MHPISFSHATAVTTHSTVPLGNHDLPLTTWDCLFRPTKSNPVGWATHQGSCSYPLLSAQVGPPHGGRATKHHQTQGQTRWQLWLCTSHLHIHAMAAMKTDQHCMRREVSLPTTTDKSPGVSTWDSPPKAILKLGKQKTFFTPNLCMSQRMGIFRNPFCIESCHEGSTTTASHFASLAA